MTGPRLDAARIAAALDQHAPTAEQAAVIEAPLEPLLVVAGAGSGKTATMVNRVVYLVAAGQVAPAGVLGLTFTRKAAGELAQRVRVALRRLRHEGLAPASTADGEPEVSTYHAYAARLFADHAVRVGREPGSRLLTEAARWQVVDRLVRAYDGDMAAVGYAPSTVVGMVRGLAGELAEHLSCVPAVRAHGERLLDDLAAAAALRATQGRARTVWTGGDIADVKAATAARLAVLPIIERFAEHKRVEELIDFGDQVALAAEIAASHPEVGRLERARFQVVLLDEYQDTGYAQEVLLAALFGQGHPVTAVGDPCQSIYGWRGASAGALPRFVRVFGHRDGTPAPRLELLTSFRNGGRILSVANDLSRPLREGAFAVGELVATPAARATGQVVVALHATDLDEADWLATRVASLGPAAGRPWSKIAVLCRKRRQFEPIRAALTAAGIPVEVVGLGGLLTVPPVADVYATLRVLVDPTAGAALLRLLTGPRWRIGPRDLVALGRRARALRSAERYVTPAGRREPDGATPATLDPVAAAVAQADEVEQGSIVEALDDLGEESGYSPLGAQRLRALQAELRSLRTRIGQPLPDLALDVIATLGLDVEVASTPGVDPTAGQAHLDAFVDAAAAFAGQDDSSLEAFLAFLAAAEDEEYGLDLAQVSAEDSVKLMTVHAAKGLEWDVVAVPGLSRGARSAVFPAKPKGAAGWATDPAALPYPLRGDRDDLPALVIDERDGFERFKREESDRLAAEELRLAYVAVTRARAVVLGSGFWWSSSGKEPLGPSEYLDTLRRVAGEHVQVDGWVEAPGEANPLLAQQRQAPWPVPVDEDAIAGVRQAAELVRRWRAATAGQAQPAPAARDARTRRWDTEIDVLLAERAAGEQRRRHVAVDLPEGLSVSALVALRADRDRFAATLARPMPHRPEPLARRGTAFHAWLEQRYGQQRLIDPGELPGSADETALPDADLDELKAAFEAGDWAEPTPVEVEVPFDMPVAGLAVRGRMDAVFADPDGGYTVVDWKTGARPDAAHLAAATVQLAAYRLAWAALAGVPPEKVRAAFYYVRTNETLAPADLLDADGLARLVSAAASAPPA